MQASYPRQCPPLDDSGRPCRYMAPSMDSMVSFRGDLCIHHGEQLMVSHSGGGTSETFSRLPPDELRRRRSLRLLFRHLRTAVWQRRYWYRLRWTLWIRRQSTWQYTRGGSSGGVCGPAGGGFFLANRLVRHCSTLIYGRRDVGINAVV